MTVTHDTSSAPDDSRLRSTIRDLGVLLGEALVQHEGPDMLELVEDVRLLVREDQQAAADRLTSVDVATATHLARAFSVYFDLANVAERSTAHLRIWHKMQLRCSTAHAWITM